MENLEIRIVIPEEELSDAEHVRMKVFQEEQGIGREHDFDGHDSSATHIIVYHQNQPVGTGRMRHVDDGVVKIERVAVLSHARGQGIGRLIMDRMHAHLSEIGIAQATLDAQAHAKRFYEGLGYVQQGDIFEEVGLPHVVMVKQLTSR